MWNFTGLLSFFCSFPISDILRDCLGCIQTMTKEIHHFQTTTSSKLNVFENQIKCDLLRTMPNNERFRNPDSDGVGIFCQPLFCSYTLVLKRVRRARVFPSGVVFLTKQLNCYNLFPRNCINGVNLLAL